MAKKVVKELAGKVLGLRVVTSWCLEEVARGIAKCIGIFKEGSIQLNSPLQSFFPKAGNTDCSSEFTSCHSYCSGQSKIWEETETKMMETKYGGTEENCRVCRLHFELSVVTCSRTSNQTNRQESCDLIK